jgi:uncharacterized protein YcbK (DUF882 family)
LVARNFTPHRSALPPAVFRDLKQRLADVQRRFGPVRIISTHRPGAVIAESGRRSKHADCRAVDFAAPAGKHAQITNWLKANHNGGVGTYSCAMNHIHIDNGAPSTLASLHRR